MFFRRMMPTVYYTAPARIPRNYFSKISRGLMASGVSQKAAVMVTAQIIKLKGKQNEN